MRLQQGFTVSEERHIPSIGSDVFKILHEPTGLNILYVKNDDKNKVFSAAFKTPPPDDSGAPHILEHSVLCGSRKYMAKDLFNELMKGSVNTYLNAMTFSDKTMYPAASVNEKDFFNLMRVYLDSVFNPLIYEEHFSQEGWNYELRRRSAPIELRGIVYNEMKGAYANPERLLIKKIDEALFAGAPYQYDAGGVPGAIPKLTYKGLMGFYDKFYRPSNCLLFLYGDLDINAALGLAAEALEGRESSPAPDIRFESGAALSALETTRACYSVNGEKKDGRYYAASFAACAFTDYYTTAALEILSYVLAGNDAAPLRAAFRGDGRFGDFSAYFRPSAYRTSLSFVAKNCAEGSFPEFKRLLRETLSEILSKGFKRPLIDGALNKWEFFINEEDFGERPKGLYYGITAASAWVYGGDVFDSLDIKGVFSRVRGDIYGGLLERLTEKYLGESANAVYTELVPKPGLNESAEKELRQRLAEYKSGLSAEGIKELMTQTRALDSFRKKPDKKRALKAIPALSPRDIPAEIVKYGCEHEGNGVFRRHEKAGIDYINLHFDLSRVPEELLPYCGLLRHVLGRTDAPGYTAESLINSLNALAGGVNYTADAPADERGNCFPRFSIKIKTLSKNTEAVLALVREVISPVLEPDSTKPILGETLLKTEDYFRSSGHSAALNRASSYLFPYARFTDSVSGIAFYNSLRENTPETVTENLKRLAELIFCAENLFIGASSDCLSPLKRKIHTFADSLPRRPINGGAAPLRPNPSGDEGFILDAGVSFNARVYNLYDAADIYSGRLKVAGSVLTLSYLWPEIRNRGGAYGCGAVFSRNGSVFFYSYRDPEVLKTYGVFDGCFNALENCSATGREFEKYIINAVKPFEKPLKPLEALDAATNDRLLGITEDMRRQEREELLSAAPGDIRLLGGALSGLAGKGRSCTIGNGPGVTSANIFSAVKNLLTR